MLIFAIIFMLNYYFVDDLPESENLEILVQKFFIHNK
jgi:hypothetical protein